MFQGSSPTTGFLVGLQAMRLDRPCSFELGSRVVFRCGHSLCQSPRYCSALASTLGDSSAVPSRTGEAVENVTGKANFTCLRGARRHEGDVGHPLDRKSVV